MINLNNSSMNSLNKNTEKSNGVDTVVSSNEAENYYFPFEQFHELKDNGLPKKAIHNRIATYIIDKEAILFLNGQSYVYQDGVYRHDKGGFIIKHKISECIYPDLRTAKTIDDIFSLIQRYSEPKEYNDVPKHPKEWINFKNGMFDVKNWKMREHDPKYLSINQIPHEFYPDKFKENPKNQLTEWLKNLIPNSEDRQMLLEYCGYCMTTDMSQQKFLVVQGTAGNGKSLILRLMKEVIGAENSSSMALQDIAKRSFNVSNFVDKIFNGNADLTLEPLEDPSLIKQIVGEDTIQGEFKYGEFFTVNLKTKFWFNTNGDIKVLNETSNGFWRRVLLLKTHEYEFVEDPHFFENVLKPNLDSFIHSCLLNLKIMYNRVPMKIHESENSLNARMYAQSNSDSVQAWLLEWCEVDKKNTALRTLRSTAYESYKEYCIDNERKNLTLKNFKESLKNKGFEPMKSMGNFQYEGIRIKDELER